MDGQTPLLRFALAKGQASRAMSRMAASKEFEAFDRRFYQRTETFFSAYHDIGLTFDDVTLATEYSEVLPRDTQLETVLAEELRLNIPVI